MKPRVSIRVRLFGALTFGTLAFVAAIAGPTSAESSSGATFLNDQPVEITVTAATPIPIVLDAINGGPRAIRMKILVVDIRSTADAKPAWNPAPDSNHVLAKTVRRIKPGRRLGLTLNTQSLE